MPYITAWSSETPTHSTLSSPTGDLELVLREHVITGQRHIAYTDERPDDRAHDVLWARMPNTPGLGHPVFASLHTGRQREVMARAGCQVCAGAGEVWMVPVSVWAEYLAVRGPGAPYETSDPPVCRACVPVAARQCPNLSRTGFMFLAPTRWAITGVRGYLGDPRMLRFGLERDVALPGALGYDPARLRLTLAKGLLVTLAGVTVHSDPDRVPGLGRRRGHAPSTPSS